MDIVDTQTRSRMMAGIKSRDTKPEMILRRFLHAQGFRFRLHDGKLPATPDIVLPRYRVAIFVHGCFWHRHAHCRLASTPATNGEKWRTKFDATIVRDARGIAALADTGWRVIVIWECGLRGKDAAHNLAWLPDVIRSVTSDFVEWPRI
jgi:DNA mismatch endonuclease (patch repair protein)